MGTATAIAWAAADEAIIVDGAAAAGTIRAGAIIAAIADCRLSLVPAFVDSLPRGMQASATWAVAPPARPVQFSEVRAKRCSA